MKRPADSALQPSKRPAITTPGSSAAASVNPPHLLSLPDDLRNKVLDYYFNCDGSSTADLRTDKRCLNLRVVSKAMLQAWNSYILLPRNDGLRNLFRQSVEDAERKGRLFKGLSPERVHEILLSAFSILKLGPLAQSAKFQAPPHEIACDGCSVKNLADLDLPVGWTGRLSGRLMVKSASEVAALFNWLAPRTCQLDLAIQSVGSEGIWVSQGDSAQWAVLLATEQCWQGQITVAFKQLGPDLAQVLSMAKWRISWRDGEMIAGHGQEIAPALHDMSWTRDEDRNPIGLPLADLSHPAAFQRSLRCSNVDLHQVNLKGNLDVQLHSIRWNQDECGFWLAPELMASRSLTDLSLMFQRTDKDEDEEAEAGLPSKQWPEPEQYLKHMAKGGNIQRLLIHLGAGAGNDFLDEIASVLRGNAGVESLSLISADLFHSAELLQALGAMKKLRQLCVIDPIVLPTADQLQTLLAHLPGLREFRLIVDFTSIGWVEPDWGSNTFPVIAEHAGLTLFEMNCRPCDASAMENLAKLVARNQQRSAAMILFDGAKTWVVEHSGLIKET